MKTYIVLLKCGTVVDIISLEYGEDDFNNRTISKLKNDLANGNPLIYDDVQVLNIVV